MAGQQLTTARDTILCPGTEPLADALAYGLMRLSGHAAAALPWLVLIAQGNNAESSLTSALVGRMPRFGKGIGHGPRLTVPHEMEGSGRTGTLVLSNAEAPVQNRPRGIRHKEDKQWVRN